MMALLLPTPLISKPTFYRVDGDKATLAPLFSMESRGWVWRATTVSAVLCRQRRFARLGQLWHTYRLGPTRKHGIPESERQECITAQPSLATAMPANATGCEAWLDFSISITAMAEHETEIQVGGIIIRPAAGKVLAQRAARSDRQRRNLAC